MKECSICEKLTDDEEGTLTVDDDGSELWVCNDCANGVMADLEDADDDEDDEWTQ